MSIDQPVRLLVRPDRLHCSRPVDTIQVVDRDNFWAIDHWRDILAGPRFVVDLERSEFTVYASGFSNFFGRVQESLRGERHELALISKPNAGLYFAYGWLIFVGVGKNDGSATIPVRFKWEGRGPTELGTAVFEALGKWVKGGLGQ